jgi:VWFA-related protein
MRLVVPAGFTNERAILDMALDTLHSGTVNNHNNVLPIGTVIAREGLSEMLARFPGRKSVIDFTGPFPPAGRMMQKATDAANTSDVSFYEIDARGLGTTVCGGDASMGAGPDSIRGGSGNCPVSPQFNGSRSGMGRLAYDTGGALFVDLNDFTPFFKQILDESTGYYLLSYESSNQRHDGRYRSISVKLIGVPGARIKSRPGYTAPKK